MARYALIIGIAEYTSNSFKSLDTPVNNANAIADLLDRHGDFDQVRRLPFRREKDQKDLGKVIRKSLTKVALERELRQFLADADGSDALIYYSGHGFTKLDTTSQKPVGGYLAPSDCRIKLNADRQVISEENGISLSHGLNKLIQQHQFSSLVVILDCCNSGAFLESAMVRQEVNLFGFERDYYLITACRGTRKAYEGEAHSLLTKAVLTGLARDNASPRSGRISGDRLFDVIGNELQNSRQEPLRMGWGKLITLVTYHQISTQSETPSASDPQNPYMGLKPSEREPFNPQNPYMGLKPFEREQADYFFGRDLAVRALLARLEQNHFLAVIGPSGSGKSSLVRAGLLPELDNDRIPGSRNWQVRIITPGQYPLQALTQALEPSASVSESLLLFVDQFEELFTLCPSESEQRSFLKRLNRESNDPQQQTRIIVAMRGDFLDRCAKFQESADLINSAAPTTYVVTPLTETKLVAELKESITGPAKLQGVGFEQGLVAQIVNDVSNQPGAMPLLQYALTQLWEECISPNGPSQELTLEGYNAIDGVRGALQRWAGRFYSDLSHEDQRFVREMISELVQIGDGDEVTRRRASRQRLREIATSEEQLDRTIGRLVHQRLLVTDDETVEVAHEALLSEIQLIRRWIEEARDGIRLQQRLEAYRREWEEFDCSEQYLLGAGRLAAIDEWIANKQPRLVRVDQEFIEKSRERRDRERQEKQRKERQVWGFGVGLLAVIAIAAGGIAYQQRENAIASNERNIQFLVDIAKNQSDNNQQLESLLTSIKALDLIQKHPIRSAQKKDHIDGIKDIVFNVQERNRFKKQDDKIIGLSIHPNFGKLKHDPYSDTLAIASGDSAGNVKLWNIYGNDIDNLERESRKEEKSKRISDLSFNHDGTLLSSSGYAGEIRIWNLESGNNIHLPGHEIQGKNSRSYALRFNDEGSKLFSSGRDGFIRVWKLMDISRLNVQLEDAIKNLYEQKAFSINGLDVSGDHVVAYGGAGDKAVRIWDSRKSQQPIVLHPKNAAFINRVKFSPDGSILVSANNTGWIHIWDVKDNFNHLIKFQAHKDEGVYDIAFGKRKNGKLIFASASRDSTINLWDLEKIVNESDKSPEPFLRFFGHTAPVNRIEFSPDNKFIISTSDDKTIRIWKWESDVTSKDEFQLEELIEFACQISETYRLNPHYPLDSLDICEP